MSAWHPGTCDECGEKADVRFVDNKYRTGNFCAICVPPPRKASTPSAAKLNADIARATGRKVY